MTEVRKIKASIAKDGQKAYVSRKNQAGAYVMRGNAIVRVAQDGNIEVVKRIPKSRVKVKEQDRVIVIK